MTSFAGAILALQAGQSIARRTWPADVFVYLQPSEIEVVDDESPLGTARPEQVGKTVLYTDRLQLYAHGVVAPWSPTADALLADDWLEEAA